MLAPDSFLLCARRRKLRGLYEKAVDMSSLHGCHVELRHVAEVLAGMSDRVPPIGAPR